MDQMHTLTRWCGVAILLALAGCQLVRGTKQQGPGAHGPLTDVQLRSKLEEFVDNFAANVEGASNAIVERSAETTMRRNAVMLKARTIPLTRRIVLERPPREAFLDLWSFSLQLHQYMVEGDGTRRFAGHQDLLSVVCDALISEIEAIGASLLAPDDFVTAKADVESFARGHAIGGALTRQAQLPSSVDEVESGGFGWMNKIPLIGAFEGLDQGAQAVRQVADVGDRFTRMASTLPEETRWQLELLLYDIESRETLVATREGIAALSVGSAKLGDAAAALPDDVRQILDDSFDRIEMEREGIEGMLGELRLAVADVDSALVRGENVARSFERTAESLARASVALEGMAHAFMDPREKAAAEKPEDEGRKPFDVEAYGDSADSIGEAATEIRTLLTEIRALAAGEEIDGALSGASERAGGLVDRIAWRTVQVVAAALVLLLAYRYSTARLRR